MTHLTGDILLCNDTILNERRSAENVCARIKAMEIILDKYEQIVMNCAVQQSGEFKIADLYCTLCSMGKTNLGRASVQILLDQLVKKKLIKKRYLRIKYLKFQPVYRSYFNKDFYLAHIEEIDISNERHKKALETEQTYRNKLESNPIYSFLHYDLMPGIIERGCLSEKERFEFKKKIDELL